jgi:thiamine biosynthesis protein ThiI
MVTFLLRYNELGLKSPPVRARFQKQLIDNIEKKFLMAGIDCFLYTDWGRIYLDTDDESGGSSILRTIFGLISFSPVIISSSELKDISDTTLGLCKELLKTNQSFALRTRRTGTHDFTSQELAVKLGSEILKEFESKNLRVDLTDPDVEIYIEVRNKKSFIFSRSISSPGGLPLGTQGKILGIFTDELSYIGFWLMMKRGCRVYPVYINKFSNGNSLSKKDAEVQVEILKPWAPNTKLKIIELIDTTPDELFSNIFSNQEFLDFLYKTRSKGICLNIELGNIKDLKIPEKMNVPVFYPLIGLNQNKISELENIIRLKE